MSGFEARLKAAWARSDALFDRLPDLFDRPIDLRHPFIFYLGHLPAFAWNQVGRAVLGKPSKGGFDDLFEFGIDPDSDAQASAQSIHAWPGVDEIFAYRDEVRAELLSCVDSLQQGEGVMCVRGRAWNLLLEHELMHHETLLYMIAAGGIAVADQVAEGDGEAAEPVRIEAGVAHLGAEFETIPFGWDNEFAAQDVEVDAFTVDSLPVRISDWRAFVDAGGPVPFGWRGEEIPTASGLVKLDRVGGWPVQVTAEQAAAYCAWKGGRLLTEAEFARIRHLDEGANTDFSHWGLKPVGQTRSPTGVRETVGNAWEWTATPFAPLPGFRAYVESYPGYSANFFDGAHAVVAGGSWATASCMLRPSFRNWYRSNYPHAFTKFRVVRS